MGSISNGMDLLALQSSVKFMVTGGVLVAAVIVDALARRNRQARAYRGPHDGGAPTPATSSEGALGADENRSLRGQDAFERALRRRRGRLAAGA